MFFKLYTKYPLLIIFYISMCMSISVILKAIVIGSTSVASRQANILFPFSDNDNEMRGFAAFEQGATLNNSSTSCIFSSQFPVSGALALNGGTLNLQAHLTLQGSGTINTVGTFNGNNYSMKLATPGALTIPAIGTVGIGATFIANSGLGARVNSLDWSYNNQYVAAGLNTGGGDEMRVLSFNGTTLNSYASLAKGSDIYTARWHPSGYYLAVAWGAGTGDINGEDFFIYELNTGTQTLNLLHQIFLTGAGWACAWHPTGNYIAMSSTNSTKELMIYSFTPSVFNLVYTVDISPNRIIQNDAMSWDPTGNYLAVGLNNTGADGDLVVYYFNGTTLTQTVSVNIAADVLAVDWSSTGSFIAVGLGGGTERLRVYNYEISNGTLTEKTTARVGESLSVASVQWRPDGNFLSIGRTSGAGTEFRVYAFDATAATLTAQELFDWPTTINTVRWSRDGNYIAVGDQNSTASIYSYGSKVPLVFNNLTTYLETDVTLNSVSLELTGTSIIEGNGHLFDFGTTGSIVVTSGATVTLRNMNIQNLSGTRLRCADSTGIIILDNVSINQSGDVTFNTGKLKITDNVYMTGPGTVFTYASNQQSQILSRSAWHFGSGMTLYYNVPVATNNLISMADSSSMLHLYETSLQSTTTGLRLTQGTLTIEGTCPVVSSATTAAQGITFGDGVTASNDLNIKILNESGLRVDSGFLVYKNVNG